MTIEMNTTTDREEIRNSADDDAPPRARILMGTEAHHLLGDLSRDEPDYFYVDYEAIADYRGHWLTGLGFINVRFPKATSRPMTDDEAQWLYDHPVVIV